MAVDCYDHPADNLAAIAATLHAMRAIERHGGALILERAFTGFMALPDPSQWCHVLALSPTATEEEIRRKRNELAKQHHPDAGGSLARMTEINTAYDSAMRGRQVRP
jgi:DnaJ-domain-containing protein 1